ncbi:protein of unknown function (plasmid) [Cupriavidus neocaledonicus]|uniref:Uncharacterized protein n=1 Tax=Cupriavidus neocaledonicus TaxID=1040979 RepID=A0A375HW34_9BURK|nr:protein of unknown function [Cupriavidus taiwanensis]SPD62349.1 protein of unknown function [Cupriavidus neocaledonicus]
MFDNCERQNHFRPASTGGIVCRSSQPYCCEWVAVLLFTLLQAGTPWYIFDQAPAKGTSLHTTPGGWCSAESRLRSMT